MSIETWLTYVATVFLLMCTPGPSQLLMLSNAMAHGWRRSLATAAGDLTANLLQMLAAGLGLAALIMTFDHALTVIKWCGVAYLVWLGLKMIRSGGSANAQRAIPARGQIRALWMQGFVTSATNPKAVVFFASLFPLFIAADRAFWPQFAILAATYLTMDALFLSGYGRGADWLAKRLASRAAHWANRIGGGFMIGAAILLGLRPVER